jgi:hypothetical protein
MAFRHPDVVERLRRLEAEQAAADDGAVRARLGELDDLRADGAMGAPGLSGSNCGTDWVGSIRTSYTSFTSR